MTPGHGARPPARAVLFVAMGLMALLAGACTSKSEGQTAQDLVNRGLRAHFANRLDEAIGHYQEALKHNPRNQFAYYNLGLIAQTRGDNVTAANDYRIALSIDPNFSSALYNLATILGASEDSREEAIQLYRRVIVVDPEMAAAYMNLGLLLRQAGEVSEGDADIAKAVQLSPMLAGRVPAPSPSPPPTASPTATAHPTPSPKSSPRR